jgi:hypothetical protein
MRDRWIVASAIVIALASSAAPQDQAAGPSVVSLTAAAQAKRDAGDMKGAVEDLTKALTLSPRNASLSGSGPRLTSRGTSSLIGSSTA